MRIFTSASGTMKVCVCVCCNPSETKLPRAYKNALMALLASILFFSGWWIMIDTHAFYAEFFDSNQYAYMPIILQTIGFIVVASIPSLLLAGVGEYTFSSAISCARFFAFMGFACTFAGLLLAIFISVSDNFLKTNAETGYDINVKLIVSNVLVFPAVFIFKLGIYIEYF